MDYVALAAELLAGHPVTGAYNVDDGLAADELNALNLSVDGGIDGMVRYLVTHDNRTNEGGDVNATLLLGRLETVAKSDPYTDPFERAGIWKAGGTGANEQIALNATTNEITFGMAHDITSLGDKDAIRLQGTTSDDGSQQIVSVTGQVVEVTSITVTETLERVMRVFKIQDAKLLTPEYIQNARALFRMFLAPSLLEIDFIDTEIELAFNDMVTAGVWKSADTDALKNLSQNQLSRAIELNFGVVETVDVTYARSL